MVEHSPKILAGEGKAITSITHVDSKQHAGLVELDWVALISWLAPSKTEHCRTTVGQNV